MLRLMEFEIERLALHRDEILERFERFLPH